MSFMGGGAECSTAGNPLNRLKTHLGDDQPRVQDRISSRPSNAAGGFRSANPAGPQDEVSRSPGYTARGDWRGDTNGPAIR